MGDLGTDGRITLKIYLRQMGEDNDWI